MFKQEQESNESIFIIIFFIMTIIGLAIWGNPIKKHNGQLTLEERESLSPEEIVKYFLNSIIEGKIYYGLLDLSKDKNYNDKILNCKLTGYEIKVITGKKISVTLILRNELGNDFKETRIFTVEDGTIINID